MRPPDSHILAAIFIDINYELSQISYILFSKAREYQPQQLKIHF